MTTFRMMGLAALITVTTPVAAINFDFGAVDGQLISTFSAGAAVRLEDQDLRLIGIANRTADGRQGRAYSTNADDGNLAFDKGDVVAAAAKLTSRLDFGLGNWGVRLHGSYVFDPILADADYFDPADYAGPAAGRTGTPAQLERRRDRLGERLGQDADLLEAYIFGSMDIGSRVLTLRVGKQVLNWGESTFVQNGLNSLASADAGQLRVPGFSLAEVYVPAGMAWAAIDLTENIALEGFYQYDWAPTEPDPSGAFFASNDFAGYGAISAEVGFGRCPELSAPGVCPAAAGGSAIPRQATLEPAGDGQGGAVLRIFSDLFGGMDIGLYAANYHSRLPLISGVAAPAGFEGVALAGGYFIEYPEDIKLYGLSFNASIAPLGVAVQGEYSLKQDQPLQLEDIEVLLAGLRTPLPSQVGPFAPSERIQGWRRLDVSQADLGFTRILGPSAWFGYDQALLLFEVAASHIHDFPEADELLFEGPGTWLPANPVVAAAVGLVDGNGAPRTQPGGYAEAFSWGYRVAARLTFNNVFNRFLVEPSLLFSHDVNGTSATPILNFVEGRQEVRAGVTASYLGIWEMQLAYTRYSGAGAFNLVNDRDNVALSLSYSF